MTQTNSPQPPPLPLLPLLFCLSAWSSSNTAFAAWSAGLPPLKRSESSRKAGREAPLEVLAKAISQEAQSRASELLEGIRLYSSSPVPPRPAEPPVIWRKGCVRILDYGVNVAASKIAPVLFIPSLINRYYILDLAEKRSFLRFLAANNVPVLLLDWGEPGEAEAAFSLRDYIEERLLPALAFISETSGTPVMLAGYCMGGILALVAAQLAPKQVKSLALFATPWDFHAKEFRHPRLGEAQIKLMQRWIEEQLRLDAAWIQNMFYLNDPSLIVHKLEKLRSLSPESPAFREFLAMECWVNDGVPMTPGVAKDCLIDWAQRNQLAQLQWKIGNITLDPTRILQPTLMVMPTHDTVVPPGASQSLLDALPNASVLTPETGHVGMMVGQRARRETWQPFLEWL